MRGKLSAKQLAEVQWDEPASAEPAAPTSAKPITGKLSPEQLAQVQFDEPAPAKPEGPKVGMGENFIRQGLRGITGGWSDEIAARIDSLLGIGDYKERRDMYRGKQEAGEQQHPKSSLAANVGGSLAQKAIPGLGQAGLFTSGLVTGLGESKAEDARGLATDAVVGGATSYGTGKAIQGAGKAVAAVGRGAAGRIEQRAVDDVLEGVKKGVQDKALAQLGGRKELPRLIKAEGLEKVSKKPADEFAAAVEGKLDEAGEALGKIYEPVSVGSNRVLASLVGLRNSYRASGDVAKFNAVQSEIDGLTKLWGNSSVVSGKAVHDVVKRYGRAGFGGNYLNPTDSRMLGREMNAAVRDVLQEEVEAATGKVKELRALNDRYSKLSALSDVIEERVARAQGNQPTLRDRFQQFGKAITDVGAIGAAVTTGSVAPLLIPYAAKAAPKVLAGADVGIAATVKALQGGMSRSEALRLAVSRGVPTAMAQQIVDKFGAGNPD